MKMMLRAAAAAFLLFGWTNAQAANVTIVAPDQVTPIGYSSANPLFVSVSGGGGGGGSVTQGTTPWADNITQFGGSNVVTGTGTSGAGIPRVTVSSDSSVTLGTAQAPIGSGAASATGVTVQGAPGSTAVPIAPKPAVSGKVVKTLVSLTANTSSTLVAANTNRLGLRIQCQGLDVVNIDETGGALTGATLEGTTTLPAGSFPLYVPDFPTQAAITAYTKTAQSCRVSETNQ